MSAKLPGKEKVNFEALEANILWGIVIYTLNEKQI